MSVKQSPRKVARGAVLSAIVGTVVIGLGAAVLSFTALTDLAMRAGTPAQLAFIWPIIVDGVIVVATIAIVALRDSEQAVRGYAWTLLFGGAVVSVLANGAHALVAVDAATPAWIAVVVASVPPIVLLAITHLTVLLARRVAEPAPKRRRTRTSAAPVAAQARPIEADAEPTISGDESEPGPVVPIKPVPAPLPVPAPERPAASTGASDDELAAWVRAQVDAGHAVSGGAAFRAGLTGSEATARRRLKALRDTSPGLFEPRDDTSGVDEFEFAPELVRSA